MCIIIKHSSRTGWACSIFVVTYTSPTSKYDYMIVTRKYRLIIRHARDLFVKRVNNVLRCGHGVFLYRVNCT